MYPNNENRLPESRPPEFHNLSENQDRSVDYGPAPFVIDIDQAAKQNTNFRTAVWTGEHIQVTLMSLKPGEDVGLEAHPELDQFIRIEQGKGLAMMGTVKNNLTFRQNVHADYAILIPAGTWHNLINTGNTTLKLYSIYAPPTHPRGTVHITKRDAQLAEH
jgi:mannose-6-phosphate isomerase-like protein (cupin superfamily)